MFKIRFKVNQSEKRLIYIVNGSVIILVCILERKKDYKNLTALVEKYIGSKNKLRLT